MKNIGVVLLVGILLFVLAGFLGGWIGIPWLRYVLFGVAGGIFAILLLRLKNP